MPRRAALILVLAGFWQAQAFAQTDPSADLANLNYYPHKGHFYSAERYQMPFYDKVNAETNGSGTTATNSTYEQFDLTLVYGLLAEGFRLGAAETWLIHRHNDVSNLRNSQTNPEDAAGLSDPTFSAAYRVFSNAPGSGLSLDFGLNGSPSLVDHRVTNTTEEGDNGKGYGTLTLDGALFWAGGWNEAEIYARVTRLFSGNSVQDAGDLVNQTSTRDSTTSAEVDLFDRVHFASRWYVQAEGDFIIPYSYDSINTPTPTITHTIATPFYVVPRLALGFAPAPWVAIDTAVSYGDFTTTTTQSTSPESQSTTKDVVWWLRTRFDI